MSTLDREQLEQCNRDRLTFAAAAERLGVKRNKVQRDCEKLGIQWHSARGKRGSYRPRVVEMPSREPDPIHFKTQSARALLATQWKTGE